MSSLREREGIATRLPSRSPGDDPDLGPHIFASYYAGAYDRVSASEPQASFRKFMG
jgi:hypothetical protein